MSEVIIYHNPRCSKSRQTLALLAQRGIQAKIVEYLITPPSAAQLQQILNSLNLSARQLIRTNEAEYEAHKLDDPTLSDIQLIAAMRKHPKLIQRPIVTCNGKAALGRPPENVLTIL